MSEIYEENKLYMIISAPLPSNSEQYISGEQQHNYLPGSYRHYEPHDGPSETGEPSKRRDLMVTIHLEKSPLFLEGESKQRQFD